MPYLSRPAAAGVPAFLSPQVMDRDCYFLDLDPPPGIDFAVACGGFELCAPDYCVERRTFRFHAIEFIAEGECEATLDGRTYPLRAGSIYCYAPTTAHRLRNVRGSRLLKFFVDLQGYAVAELLRSSLLCDGPRHIPQYRWLHEIFLQLHDAGKRGGPAVQRIARLLVELLVERLNQLAPRAGDGAGRASSTYERCRSYLTGNYRTIKSVDELAQACHVTRTHLSRLFRRHARRVPSEILFEYKMSEAARMLSQGSCLIKEVAAGLGFEDPYYFSRAFKRYHGVSPRGFRDRLVHLPDRPTPAAPPAILTAV